MAIKAAKATTSLITLTVLIFPKFDVSSMGQGAEAAVKLFATAFGFGFGWHAIVDEVAKWTGAFKDANDGKSKR